MAKIKVLVVDDSALVRQLLTEILNSDSGIEVVGTASDPLIARDKIKELNPDVLTLDVEMPKMDGITFLKNLMRLRPMPVVMVSTLTEKGADLTLNALELGAVDIVSKPKIDLANALQDYAEEIIGKVKNAATANVRAIEKQVKSMQVDKKLSADAILEKQNAAKNFNTTDKLIAIGASTGGTEAIKDVLIELPADTPGTVITQHIPEAFSASFAARMNSLSKMVVCEAEDGQQILAGHVYIAPGDKHLMVKRNGARYICELNDGPRVNRHKPSVDVLFRSVAQCAGQNAIAIILTGMGDDGAKGMEEMHNTGAPTIAQDEKSSVVWGMPGEAVKLGCVDHVVPLNLVAQKILRHIPKD
ncbi:MAG: chemotaxis response regulator protein-glutamate methylesterase [Gammaproteobacteria bacterium]|nr:chemotaxis response regulator protein-glutamate methylesterase [Gammaproteobacteria bacterium]